MASNSSEDAADNLKEVFKTGLDLYNNISKTEESTNSPSVQVDVIRAMQSLENATRLVSMIGLFSTNETIEEVSTSELQYMLLPALLGSLSLKLTTGDRKEIIEVAEVYFKDFLKRCNNYELSDYVFKDQDDQVEKPEQSTEQQQLTNMVMTRQNKIRRFYAEKQLKEKLESLTKNMENEHADEEIKREYFLTMIKMFIYQAIEELNSIEMEKPLLLYKQQAKENEKGTSGTRKEQIRHKPLKPVIITKDEVQKAVFGLGYPSLPTMTVSEFYDKRIRDGIFPDPSKPKQGPQSLQEAAIAGIDLNSEADEIKKENKIENDDPDNLNEMRQMDEYKDDHRRGWGNRMNRS